MQPISTIILCTILFLASPMGLATPLPLKSFLQRPKLVVVIVIDQFRSDYLTRLHSRFVPANSKGEVGGFDFLMNQGAYFPFAEYNVLQAMTCPGHAMIMTGSTPEMLGIPLNEWFDRKTQKMTYCVEDAEFGLSPKNLRSSTVSDEMKLISKESKVFGLALKDRSAIMLAGHHANLALWFDGKSNQWVSSEYYTKILPKWAQGLNDNLKKEKDQEYIWKTPRFEKKAPKGSKLSMMYPYGTEQLMKLAEETFRSEGLGRNKATDFLLISLSNHDYMGHNMGPLAPEIEELTIAEDQQISKLLTTIKKGMGGLQNVAIVLTADHGTPPLIEDLQAAHIEAGKIDYLALYKTINQVLDAKYGTPSNKEWIAASKSFHFYLNPQTLKEKKIPSEEIENQIREILLQQKGVWKVFTRTDYFKNNFPVGELEKNIKSQFIPETSGDLILIPKPYFMEKDDNLTTHMTGFSYDRQVPLIIYHAKIKAGVYSSPASMTDLAPTLSFLLGITAPAANVGHVLPIF